MYSDENDGTCVNMNLIAWEQLSEYEKFRTMLKSVKDETSKLQEKTIIPFMKNRKDETLLVRWLKGITLESKIDICLLVIEEDKWRTMIDIHSYTHARKDETLLVRWLKGITLENKWSTMIDIIKASPKASLFDRCQIIKTGNNAEDLEKRLKKVEAHIEAARLLAFYQFTLFRTYSVYVPVLLLMANLNNQRAISSGSQGNDRHAYVKDLIDWSQLVEGVCKDDQNVPLNKVVVQLSDVAKNPRQSWCCWIMEKILSFAALQFPWLLELSKKPEMTQESNIISVSEHIIFPTFISELVKAGQNVLAEFILTKYVHTNACLSLFNVAEASLAYPTPLTEGGHEYYLVGQGKSNAIDRYKTRTSTELRKPTFVLRGIPEDDVCDMLSIKEFLDACLRCRRTGKNVRIAIYVAVEQGKNMRTMILVMLNADEDDNQVNSPIFREDNAVDSPMFSSNSP
ncbi:hypothetical protein ACFE04_022662 [Oxalis oulophora]